jgi:hypothetical protein
MGSASEKVKALGQSMTGMQYSAGSRNYVAQHIVNASQMSAQSLKTKP